ncbi:MAG TPA: glycosyltransferase family 4 protein [Acidimicrobiales bacterium]|nr:glycosyltransferase family 4 protein [Acidimicrobiales bacterium]
MRIAVLWPGPSGYLSSCLSALQDLADVLLAAPAPWPQAPFDEKALAPLENWYRGNREGKMDDAVLPVLESFRPDAILVSSWNIAAYRRAVRAFRGRALRVLCMDNCWRNHPKQWLGRVVFRPWLAPLYECVFVPGERQARFARMLGVTDRQIIRGLYTADCAAFERRARPPADVAEARRFLFAARLVDSKGTDVLGEAYRRYRQGTADPWPLTVAGTGPGEHHLRHLEGVELEGFCQPSRLADLMHRSTCLVLPSRWEPWGVVVHEAACAGLALICTTAVGAADAFLQHGFNGRLVPSDDPDELAAALREISNLTPAELTRYSAGSRSLAGQLSPDQWAHQLVREIERRWALVVAQPPRAPRTVPTMIRQGR